MGVIVSPPGQRGRDPYTKLLLTGDAVTDASLSGRTLTNNGVTVMDATGTNKPAGVAKSLYFNGSSAKLAIPYSDDFNFGSGDFTLDAWVCPYNALPNNYALFQQYLDNSNRVDFMILGGNFLRCQHEVGGSQYYAQGSCAALAANAWSHLAWVRSDGAMRIYKDGVAITFSADTLAGSEPFSVSDSAVYHIGYWTVSSYYFPGQIANLRISKGIARWTRDFTPPQRAY
ncbi:hypothetical protein JCM15519_16970 [Fundidesulfovibrio butyratiphilus]